MSLPTYPAALPSSDYEDDDVEMMMTMMLMIMMMTRCWDIIWPQGWLDHEIYYHDDIDVNDDDDGTDDDAYDEMMCGDHRGARGWSDHDDADNNDTNANNDIDDDDMEMMCDDHKGARGWSDEAKPLISAHQSQQNNHLDEEEHHHHHDHDHDHHHHHHRHDDHDVKLNQVALPASVIPARWDASSNPPLGNHNQHLNPDDEDDDDDVDHADGDDGDDGDDWSRSDRVSGAYVTQLKSNSEFIYSILYKFSLVHSIAGSIWGK